MMYTRKCPQCNSEIQHTMKCNRDTAFKEKRTCKSCYIKNRKDRIQNDPEFKEKCTKNLWHRTGSPPPTLGRKKTPEEIEKIRMGNIGKKASDETKRKMSILMSGENNPMYGKPSPQGSGNGWKGWFKNKYFQSLRELMYMISLHERNKDWISGRKIRIPYEDWDKKSKTYSPDFIVDNLMIEIKPIKLHNSPQVVLKKKVAETYCKEHNMIYVLLDVKIDATVIKKYMENEYIKWYGDYGDRFKKDNQELFLCEGLS